MSEITIVVDAATIRRSGPGPLTGSIWFVLNGGAFPLEGWDDFVVVVLEAVTAAMARILSGSTKTERVHFMEGPYALEFQKVGSDLHLHAFEQRQRDVDRGRFEVPCQEFWREVLVAADQVLAACRHLDVWSRDAENLSINLAAIRGAVVDAVRIPQNSGLKPQ